MRASPPRIPSGTAIARAHTLTRRVTPSPERKAPVQPAVGGSASESPKTRPKSQPLSGPVAARKARSPPTTATVTRARSAVAWRRLDLGEVLAEERMEASVLSRPGEEAVQPVHGL